MVLCLLSPTVFAGTLELGNQHFYWQKLFFWKATSRHVLNNIKCSARSNKLLLLKCSTVGKTLHLSLSLFTQPSNHTGKGAGQIHYNKLCPVLSSWTGLSPTSVLEHNNGTNTQKSWIHSSLFLRASASPSSTDNTRASTLPCAYRVWRKMTTKVRQHLK